MVIVIKNADFSANNLGQVEVKRVINQFTLAAINASGNQSMTNEQKSALDTFFETIGAFGNKSEIWGKLDKIYIPFLCSSLSKACVNYKTNRTDKELSAERYTLRNRGVTGVIENPANYTESNISDMHVINSSSLTVVSMLMEDNESLTEQANLIAYEGNSGANRFFSFISKSGNGVAAFGVSYIKPTGDVILSPYPAYPFKHALFGITIRSAYDYTEINKESVEDKTSELSVISNTGTDTSVSKYTVFTSSTGAALSSLGPSIGLLIIGKSLTHEDAVTLKSASETLVGFFK